MTITLDWDKLSKQLTQEVAKQDRVHYIAKATLPKKYSGFKDSYAFQLNDGTIYVLEDTIKERGEEDVLDIVKHEMAHRVLGHKQPHEEGEEEDAPVAQIIKGMSESLRHEVDVNLLLGKTYGFQAAQSFVGEITGWLRPYVERGNVPYGDAFAVIRKGILNRSDVPSAWKDAVIALRRRAAGKFAERYGYSAEYADGILDHGKEPGEAEFNDLVKHVWFGMSSPPVGEDDDDVPTDRSVISKKTKKVNTKKAVRKIRRSHRIETQARGLRS